MKTAFDRRRKTIVSMLNEIEGVYCPMPEGAFYAYPSVKGLLGKELRRPASSTPRPSWRSTSSTPPRSPSCRVRRSAPRATCGSPTRSATTTSSRASPGCRSSSVELNHSAREISRGSRRRTSTCTSRGPCGTRRWSSSPTATASSCPTRSRRTGRRSCRRPTRRAGSVSSGSTTWRARCCERQDDVRRLVLEAAEDDVRDGGRWLEIQVDPSGYAARFGGITTFTDLVLDCVRDASRAHRPRDRGDHRRQPHASPDGRPDPRAAGGAVRRPRCRRLRPLQRRAARDDLGVRPRLLDRRARRTGADAARRRADGSRVRADLSRHAARRPARPRHQGNRGPRAARADRRAGRGAGGLPGLQRGPRGLLRPHVRAAAPAARSRRHRGPRRRRPVAVRVAAGRPVRHHARGPRAHRRAARRAGPDVRARLPGAVRRGQSMLADIDAWLAEDPAAT